MASNLALTLEPRQCQVCHTRIGLKPCSSCKLVYHCCPEHRARDVQAHQRPCTIIQDAINALFREAYKLRYGEDGNASPPLRYFEDDVGQFWQVPETRPYMRERFNLVQATLSYFKNIAAVETSLDHLTDMLRLCHFDTVGARHVLPTLHLRLGRDQECYDFIKWWANTASNADYNWSNRDAPYLDVRDADALECPVQGLSIDDGINLSHGACVALIKVRILLDLRNMQNLARAFHGVLPQEIIDIIRGQALISSVLAARKDIIQAPVDETADLLQLVKSQVKMLFDAVGRRSWQFWPAMIRCGEPGTRIIRGLPMTEDIRAFNFNYDAWSETPGAIEVIRKLAEAA